MGKNIAEVIKRIRASNGLTQEKLAELIERSPGHVGMLEQGRATPSYEVMERLVVQFDLDANVFFEGAQGGRSDAESISANIAQTLQGMSNEVRECLSIYAQVVDQFSKTVNDSNNSD